MCSTAINVAVLAAVAAATTACLPTPRFNCDSDDDCQSGATPGFCEANRVCSFADPACTETGRRHGKLDGREAAAAIDGTHAVANQCVLNFCPSDQVLALALGPGHSCLVRASGQVWCWGRNDFGQLGDGTTTPRSEPVQVLGLEGAVEIALGESHTCVRRSERDVWCWGRNDEGQLGDGNLFASRSTPAPTDLGAVVTQIAAGTRSSCALTNQGQVFCWGGNTDGEIGQGAALTPLFAGPAAVKGLPNAESISMRSTHACAVVSGGGVWCWGSNTLGQLGDGTTSNRRLPVAVPGIEDAQAIATGRLHTCALRATGTALCWGHNGSGQLGTGELVASPSPVAVRQLDQLVEVAAGGDHTCARQASGAVSCWGGNSFGQLGDGTSTGTALAQTVGDLAPGGADRLALGDGHTCVRRKDLTVWCWGDDREGQLGQRRLIKRLEPGLVAGLSDVRAVAAGAEHTCAVTGDDRVRCFGAGAFGRLGQGSGEDATTPVVAPLIEAPSSIAAGGKHTCAVGPGGVSCWGRNDVGQLATGQNADVFTPSVIGALVGMRGVSLGASHGCAIRAADGLPICWGGNQSRQVGRELPLFAAPPTPVPGLGVVVEIAAGGAHTCTRDAAGGVWCFGVNSDGQLGRAPSAPSAAAPVGLPAALSVVAGSLHSCALLAGGTVQCWGRSREGQLGSGTAQDGSAVPVAALGLHDAVAISAGGAHTCVLPRTGGALCFGANVSGQLGDGTTTAAFAPVPVRSPASAQPPWRALAAGGAHTCAITSSHKLVCWGDNTHGQLGAGGALMEPRPRPVPLGCR